jgi:ferritin-like protein
MASEGLHESAELLSPQTKDLHRAIVSLMEELEAIDWYQQRVDAADDTELKEILAHNRDEEKEHAAMVLEWIRRRDSGFDGKLREYLFTEGNIVAKESAGESGNGTAANGGNGAAGVGIGSLRGARAGASDKPGRG